MTELTDMTKYDLIIEVEALREWRAKAEDKILELAAAPAKPKGTHIEWIKVTDGMEAKADGYYTGDGEDEIETHHVPKGDEFSSYFEECGGNLHIAGPFNAARGNK